MSLFPLIFDPPVIAHRGARTEAPENTLAAFERVIETGAKWLETDVKLTHDGVPVLLHDETLERTTNGHGNIADKSWKDVQMLDAGSWFGPEFKDETVPRLTTALQLVLERDLQINLELKPCPGRTKATVIVTLIEASKIWPEYQAPPLISSFDIDALTISAQMHPEWPRGLLLEDWHENWGYLLSVTTASTININETCLTQHRVATLKQANLPILAYTVNDPARAKELLHWGVSAVFSDNPREIILGL